MEIRQTEFINNLTDALSKAQGEIENATKSTANSYFNSKYADLAEVISALKEPLAKNGLSYVQFPSYIEETGYYSVTTRVMHSSGQWLEGTLKMKPVKNDPQGGGSVITYMRRYSLAAIFGVAQEDDDGNSASGLTATSTQAKVMQMPQKTAPPQPPVQKPSGVKELKEQLLSKIERDGLEKFLCALFGPLKNEWPTKPGEYIHPYTWLLERNPTKEDNMEEAGRAYREQHPPSNPV